MQHKDSKCFLLLTAAGCVWCSAKRHEEKKSVIKMETLLLMMRKPSTNQEAGDLGRIMWFSRKTH